MNTPYEWDRTENLLKIKDMESMECTVLYCEKGTGRNSERLGALVVEQENKTVCSVGSGFDDEEREQFWNNQDDVVGKVVEVQYQELTPDGVMRFPTFKRFRNDKTQEIKWQDYTINTM